MFRPDLADHARRPKTEPAAAATPRVKKTAGQGTRAPWKALSPSPPKRPRGPPIPSAVLNAAARWRPEDEDEDDDRTAPYLQ